MIKKSNAFTLAEVLVTLGVIGVIAAITIPSLIKNYQKASWVAQLKKSYAVFNEGFKLMLSDDAVFKLSETEVFKSAGGSSNETCSYSDDIDSDNCKDFYKNLGKYFKIVDIKKFTASDNYEIATLANESRGKYKKTAIMLTDGTILFNYFFDRRTSRSYTNNEMMGAIGGFYVDVNGIRKPNIVGRDIFEFYIGDNGLVYPNGSHATSMLWEHDKNSLHWKYAYDDNTPCKTPAEGCCCSNGDSCAARVLEEGKMSY